MAEMKKQKQKARMFGIVSLAVFVGATLLIVFAMSKTIAEVREIAVSNSSDILLANAGLKENEGVNLQVSYFDQRADECVNVYDDTQMALLKERQFGWFECGYYNERLEQGMVGFELDEQYLPIAKSGDLITNRGLFDMSRWFSEVEGKSKAFIGTIRLDYNPEDTSFSFHQNSFYPLDKVEYDKSEIVNKDGHNHLFTMNFAVPFTVLANGNESFMVTADDDTFVYVGDKLVLDMGGIHDAMSGEVAILDNGEVHSGIGGAELAYSGVNVQHGDSSIVRIFHADRNEEDSVFKMTFVGMNLGVVDTRLADGDDGGVQIAYDPNDPSYVAPLGESSVVKPDTTKGYAILATIEGVVVVALAFLVVFSAKLIIVRKTK